jgi:cell shape-determining protein MreC
MRKQPISLIIAGIIFLIIGALVLTGSIPKIVQKLPLIGQVFAQNTTDNISPEQLQAQVTSLEAEVASLLYVKSENDLLKSAIETKNDTGIIPIQAKIVTFDNDFTRSSATVTVGSKEGVKVNQPVIYLGYLVGQVKEVSESSSKIQFLNDADSKIAVQIQKDIPSQGILKSQFGTVLEVDSVPKLEAIVKDQNIITTPTETIPAGLLVGKIKDISEGDLFHRIIVEYPINFYQLTQVFILKT